MEVYTIGYSGFSPEAFLQTLKNLGVEVLIDVRRFPRSKTAFFSAESLKEALNKAGISYVWLGELGALGVRGPRAGCVESETFDSYVWRLYHYAPSIFQLDRLLKIAEKHTSVLMCREENWRHCHRQFLADFLVERGRRVLHIRSRGALEEHVKTSCYGAFRLPPVELVKRVYQDFGHLCQTGPVYLFGGALEGSTADIDVVIYGVGEGLPEGYDAQFIPAPRADLFHFHVTYNGVLICGKPLVIPFEQSLLNELAETEERVFLYLNSRDPVVVCKAAKELAFAAAAVLCGPGAATWNAVKKCLKNYGVKPPDGFKRCLTPPSLSELRKYREVVEKLASFLREARGQAAR
ncbi:conserved hypothetical protein [Pyrobaculum aerophilum str. IM2]|uniref:DUF488 domain-containing protein n=2 Tax=Pyrobaculum aerophilum TaxID=13773 RepID=Q8ZYU7_PYRAE|nr:DUF488 family protein [Pyrobaculum aerophilum]AAL62896.1 conserved hypothetical protein [Pyrobaculum aerophilum str. IM2]HII46031.1 DUF488 family protein [Pyrobaculum aerophilum]